MIFEASRAKAVDKLNTFVEQNLSDYSKLRNFDFGPSNRSNVSCLSPYITHGIINELEVVDKSLIMEDQKQRLKDKSIDCEVIDISEIKNIENYYGLYPAVGENLDYLNSNNIRINFLYRNLDQLAWQYCNKGFFNFKSYIPKIISTFN